jgi:hypothetical protein
MHEESQDCRQSVYTYKFEINERCFVFLTCCYYIELSSTVQYIFLRHFMLSACHLTVNCENMC